LDGVRYRRCREQSLELALSARLERLLQVERINDFSAALA
jgi:hypothetical protein